MSSHRSHRIAHIIGACLMTGVMGSAALADDTEIFFGQIGNNTTPNILLIIDTSGSMNETAGTTHLPYVPTTIYPDSPTDTNCDNDKIYYVSSSTVPSSCSSLSYIQLTGGNFSATNPREIKCKRAVDALAWGGTATGPGFYSDRFIRWRGQGNSRTWQASLNNPSGGTIATDVECVGDEGTHGDTAASSAKWPRSGNASQDPGRWTSTNTQSWWTVAGNAGISRTLYSPNYIRYVANGSQDVQTRMEVVKAAAASFIDSLPDVNLGVMRYSANSATYVTDNTAAAGGMVMSRISPLDAKRADLKARITGTTGTPANDKDYKPFGWTPLSETLFEAYQYYRGGAVTYGRTSRRCINVPNEGNGATGNCASAADLVLTESDPLSRTGSTYNSPITQSCQKNYVIFLTDGLPTQDTDVETTHKNNSTVLPNFASLGGNCLTTDPYTGAGGADSGRCLGALAQYMHTADLRSTLAEDQTVTTHFIGFGAEFAGNLSAAFSYLSTAAS
ncbi:MAG TPA: VWA domain-containing protein, partial [Steroidobacteraceae bacterium]|nr:VWA domain-containing protein [Steroidobacteraceae bacterium]